MKNFVYYIQEALPLRLKAVHFINMVPMIERILAMARPFLKKELLEMIHFHTNVDGLFPFIPQRNLPVEYGGDSESLFVAKSMSTMISGSPKSYANLFFFQRKWMT